MSELERVIANLGYPVGMGIAPSPADLARMKSAIIKDDDIWVGLERAKDVRNAAIEECAKEVDRVACSQMRQGMMGVRAVERLIEAAAAIRALKDKP